MNDIFGTVLYWSDNVTGARLFRLSTAAKEALTHEDLLRCHARNLRLLPFVDQYMEARLSLVRLSAADAPVILARFITGSFGHAFKFNSQDFAAAYMCALYRGNRRTLSLLEPYKDCQNTDFSRLLVSMVELTEGCKTSTGYVLLKSASRILQRDFDGMQATLRAFLAGAISGKYLIRELPEPRPEDSILRTSLCASIVELIVMFVRDKVVSGKADFNRCPDWVLEAPPLPQPLMISDWATPLTDEERTFAKRNIIISNRALNLY